MRTTRLAISAVLVALVMGGPALGPAGAATAAPPAPKPKPAESTWLGRVEREGSRYAYVGRACPEQAAICYDIVATYRIVALNPAAARAVRHLAGGQARLHGHLGPAGDRDHTGTLFVTRAESPKGHPARTVAADETTDGRTVTLRRGAALPAGAVPVVGHRPGDRLILPPDGMVSGRGGRRSGPGR